MGLSGACYATGPSNPAYAAGVEFPFERWIDPRGLVFGAVGFTLLCSSFPASPLPSLAVRFLRVLVCSCARARLTSSERVFLPQLPFAWVGRVGDFAASRSGPLLRHA